MSVKLTADFDGSLAIAELQRISNLLKRPQAMWKEAGRAVANQIRKHLTEQNAKPNKLGGARTNFYDEVRQATGNPELEGDGVSITIADPRFALQVYGGDVVAKEKAALTIPLHALAHGRRVSVFEDTTGIDLFRPKGKNVLMGMHEGEVKAFYALVKRVTVRKNPNALPTQDAMDAVAVEQAGKHLERALANGTALGS